MFTPLSIMSQKTFLIISLVSHFARAHHKACSAGQESHSRFIYYTCHRGSCKKLIILEECMFASKPSVYTSDAKTPTQRWIFPGRRWWERAPINSERTSPPFALRPQRKLSQRAQRTKMLMNDKLVLPCNKAAKSERSIAIKIIVLPGASVSLCGGKMYLGARVICGGINYVRHIRATDTTHQRWCNLPRVKRQWAEETCINF